MKKINLATKKLKVHQDQRGWLAEILRGEAVKGSFGQLLITVAKPGFTKGNHYHLRKREWYCVVGGRGELSVWSKDGKNKTKLQLSSEELMLVEMPKKYFHKITNNGDEDLVLVVYLSEPYNPDDPDTFYE